MALEVNTNEFKKEVLEAAQPVLVDFWAPWCGPCRMQAPILDDFAKENSAVKIVKVNVDDNPELAAHFNIMSIPSLLVFKNGVKVNQAIGLQSKADLAMLIK